jgi:hypothetical protein
MNLVRGLLRKSPNPAAAPAPASPSVRGGCFPGADLDDAPEPRVVFRYVLYLWSHPVHSPPCDLFVRVEGS